jgi:hypothetical protein
MLVEAVGCNVGWLRTAGWKQQAGALITVLVALQPDSLFWLPRASRAAAYPAAA